MHDHDPIRGGKVYVACRADFCILHMAEEVGPQQPHPPAEYGGELPPAVKYRGREHNHRPMIGQAGTVGRRNHRFAGGNGLPVIFPKSKVEDTPLRQNRTFRNQHPVFVQEEQRGVEEAVQRDPLVKESLCTVCIIDDAGRDLFAGRHQCILQHDEFVVDVVGNGARQDVLLISKGLFEFFFKVRNGEIGDSRRENDKEEGYGECHSGFKAETPHHDVLR